MKKHVSILFSFLVVLLVLAGCEEGMMEDDATPSGELALADGRKSYSTDGSASGGGSTPRGNDQIPDIEPGMITAGEWKDLDHWEFWQNLLNEKEYDQMTSYWGFDLQFRVAVAIKSSGGNPVVDVPVTLKMGSQILWVAKTDNKGKAELWSRIFSHEYLRTQQEDLVLEIDGGAKVYKTVRFFDQGVNQLSYSSFAQVPNKAELAFVVDATGSMGDELEYLKVELLDVIGRAKSENPSTSFLTGTLFYRDEGDEYLTRISPFSADIHKTLNFIGKQSANGGGDLPEAVHIALDEAVNHLQWSSQARARILFLLLDAPPHYRTDVIKAIQSAIKAAAAKGIKVIPITASGIDKETEFLMRFFGISTNGTYVFITNHSGIGGDHLEPTVGDYEVEYLNDLMVRLINESLEYP